MEIRTTLQPLQPIEADEHDVAVLRHQGLLWTGTDAELAALYTAAGLPAPVPAPPAAAAPPKPAPVAPAPAAAATTAPKGV